jgi:hypothetical protein
MSEETKATPVDIGNESGWIGELIRLVSVVLIVMIGFVAYHNFFAGQNKQRFAVVDISQVLQLKELQVMAASTQSGSAEKPASETFDEISRFASDIEAAIGTLKEECNCTLLVKTAVIKPDDGDDLTPMLKKRLGMANLDEAALLQRIRTSVMADRASNQLEQGQNQPLSPRITGDFRP